MKSYTNRALKYVRFIAVSVILAYFIIPHVEKTVVGAALPPIVSPETFTVQSLRPSIRHTSVNWLFRNLTTAMRH